MELFDRLDALSGKAAPTRPASPACPGRRSTPSTRSWPACSTCTRLPATSRRSRCSKAWPIGPTSGAASKSEEHMQEILNTEYGGIAETLYNLAAVTKNDQWAKAGDRFTKKRFVNPLAMRRDELRGLHVNTHIPQVIAAARRYEISGDTRFHDVADFFWYEVVSARSYVTGGTSNGEGWQAQPRQLAAELRSRTIGHRGMLLLVQHAEAHAASLRLDRRPRATSITTSARCSITASARSFPRKATRSITSRSRRARGRRSTPRTSRSGAAPGPAWRSTPNSTTASTGATRRACTSTFSSLPS